VLKLLLPLEVVRLDHILAQAVLAAIILLGEELAEQPLQVEVVGREAMEVVFYQLLITQPTTRAAVVFAITEATLGDRLQLHYQVEEGREDEVRLLQIPQPLGALASLERLEKILLLP
jgi:hypothetical protein